MIKKFALGLLLAVLLGVVAIQAQAPTPSGVKRNMLVKQDLTPMPATTAYVVEVEFAPGEESGWHTHPGPAFDTVRSGEEVVEIEGKPPQTLKSGMGIYVEPGVVHNVKNASKTAPLKTTAFLVIVQGKPVAVPASAPAKK
jgi:quercetin dioxygenase-like cupin family protein